MSYTKTHDLTVVTGSYQKDGQNKNSYENVGMIMVDSADPKKKLFLLKRTFNPAGVPNPDGKSMVIVNAFPVKEQQRSAPPPEAKPAPQGDFDDDIPF